MRARGGRLGQLLVDLLQKNGVTGLASPRVPRANGDFGRADPSDEPLATRARLAAAASSALTVRVDRGGRGRAETPQLCAGGSVRLQSKGVPLTLPRLVFTMPQIRLERHEPFFIHDWH